MTQKKLFEVLHHDAPIWARIWGAIYAHRQLCVWTIRDTVYEMLDDPEMTRSKMRREVADVVKQVEEWGP